MKRLFQIIFILGTIKSFGQTKEVILQGDSLFVRDENIATNPFNFGHNPLNYLNSKDILPSPTIEWSTVANRHVENDIDTAYAIKFKQDSFRVYKWGKEENALLYSELRTDRFITRHGIKVGMSKAQVKDVLKDYNIATIPKYLILENAEITEYLTLEFNKDVLVRIEFQGYVD